MRRRCFLSPNVRGGGGIVVRIRMDRSLLDFVFATVGEPRARDGEAEFVGTDPVLPSPLRIGEAGAAVIGAAAVQAARLWQFRTGRAQHVRVDVDAAAVAMRSSRYL